MVVHRYEAINRGTGDECRDHGVLIGDATGNEAPIVDRDRQLDIRGG